MEIMAEPLIAGRTASAEIERLIDQMREANERLIVSAVTAQESSDQAHIEVERTRTELDGVMRQLRDANERLAASVARANVMAEDARRSEEAYRDLSVRLLQVQDEERRRVAIELHDSMVQLLAALTMNLDLLDVAKDRSEDRQRRLIAESRAIAEQCTLQARTTAHVLYPPLLAEMGLAWALKSNVAGFIERSGILVELDVDLVDRLPEPIEIALFRVVQESLTNIHHHASSATASIHLARTSDAVVLDIRDQGQGLRDSQRPTSDAPEPVRLGVGIRGMQERIRHLGGTFEITFEAGTKVHVCVPLRSNTP
jgi:two-component system NarL family sensor kinase